MKVMVRWNISMGILKYFYHLTNFRNWLHGGFFLFLFFNFLTISTIAYSYQLSGFRDNVSICQRLQCNCSLNLSV